MALSGEAIVPEILAAARLARPDLALDVPSFERFLLEREGELGVAVVPHAGDLALVFCCSKGDPRALRVFDRDFLSQMPTLLPARWRSDAAEVAQVLRCRLLLPDVEGNAKIADFAGRGGLLAWLRVAGTRVAQNLARSKKRDVELEENDVLAERAGGDVEMDHLKQRYRREFKEAFAAALEALDPRARNLLRQHYLDGVTMEAIATIYQVHRLTIVRWMEKARASLSKETRRELTARLKIDRHELESILRLIESRVEVTFSDVLRA